MPLDDKAKVPPPFFKCSLSLLFPLYENGVCLVRHSAKVTHGHAGGRAARQQPSSEHTRAHGVTIRTWKKKEKKKLFPSLSLPLPLE